MKSKRTADGNGAPATARNSPRRTEQGNYFQVLVARPTSMEERLQPLEANPVENSRDIVRRAFANMADYIKIQRDGSIVFDFLAPNWSTTAGGAANPAFVENTPLRKPSAVRLLEKHLTRFGAIPLQEADSTQPPDPSDPHFEVRTAYWAFEDLVRILLLPTAIDRKIDQALEILGGVGTESIGESGSAESQTAEGPLCEAQSAGE